MNIYEGNENYIFVSYARADVGKVIPILESLEREGFRFWYDSAIEVGSEWPDYVEDRVMNCRVMIYFVTANSIESKNCRDEVNYALSEKKEILVVYLEETKLKYGLALRLSTNQALHKRQGVSENEFVNAIMRAKLLQSCKQTSSSIMSSATYSPPVAQNVHKRVYISYRRDGGDIAAKTLSDALKARGVQVFLDADSLRSGYFDSQIYKAIVNDDNYILVLSPNALDRCKDDKDWLREEISMALKVRKNIIPVFLSGFSFPKDLPEEIAQIKQYNGISFSMTFFDGMIDAIISRFV
jgi:hypothetical protein